MAIHRLVLLDALRHIKLHGPASTLHCICGSVADTRGGYYSPAVQQLEALIVTWPDRASDDRFPVEGCLFEYAADDNKWQNPRRRALLDWLIHTIEQEQPTCAACDSTASLRRACYEALDALWLDSPTTTRSDAHDMMHAATGVRHIGSATEDDCKRILAWLDSL